MFVTDSPPPAYLSEDGGSPLMGLLFLMHVYVRICEFQWFQV